MSETRSEIVWYLMVEVLLFTFAALAHGGVIMPGNENPRAATLETVVAVVLGAGLIMSFVNPWQTRIVGLVAQGLALLGAVVGLVLILAGADSRSLANLVVYAIMLITLVIGLLVAKRGMPT